MQCKDSDGLMREEYTGRGTHTCDECFQELAEGEQVFSCKRTCDWDACIYCVIGEPRPEKINEEEEVEAMGGNGQGATHDGVPTEKAGETDHERKRRKTLEIQEKFKDRILDANTNGLAK